MWTSAGRQTGDAPRDGGAGGRWHVYTTAFTSRSEVDFHCKDGDVHAVANITGRLE